MPENSSLFRFDRAIVRRPGRSVVRGLRCGGGADPDYDEVRVEHGAYVAALRAAGVAIDELPALEAFPDSVFVEDPALVFSEGAIVLRMAAPARAGEPAAIAPALREHFETLLTLPEPGFVDGGDVLVTPRAVIIGLSARTDRPGAEGLKECLTRLGYRAKIAETPPGVLHLKSACSLIDEQTVLTTGALARAALFDGFDKVITPEGEDAAANALRVNDVVFVGAGFPRTIDLLERRGFNVVALPTTEIGKLDAGLSCMSLRWRTPA